MYLRAKSPTSRAREQPNLCIYVIFDGTMRIGLTDKYMHWFSCQDKYILGSMAILCCICVWHAVVPLLNASETCCTPYSKWADNVALMVLAAVYIGFHLIFVFVIAFVVSRVVSDFRLLSIFDLSHKPIVSQVNNTVNNCFVCTSSKIYSDVIRFPLFPYPSFSHLCNRSQIYGVLIYTYIVIYTYRITHTYVHQTWRPNSKLWLHELCSASIWQLGGGLLV